MHKSSYVILGNQMAKLLQICKYMCIKLYYCLYLIAGRLNDGDALLLIATFKSICTICMCSAVLVYFLLTGSRQCVYM